MFRLSTKDGVNTGLVFFHGERTKESSQRMHSGNYWDHPLFVADMPERALMFGWKNIRSLSLNPAAHVLREGTSKFNQIAGNNWKKGVNTFEWVSNMAQKAQKAGYDFVQTENGGFFTDPQKFVTLSDIMSPLDRKGV